MAESFNLTVSYKREERDIEAELRVFGYTHKIAVMMNGAEILFEPDEERNYRAILPYPPDPKIQADPELLRLIAEELNRLFA